MGPMSPVRSRLMRSRATKDVQPLHEGRIGVRLCADLCVPLPHNALSPFNRPLAHDTHAHVVSVIGASRRSCGRGVAEQSAPPNSESAFVLVKKKRTNLKRTACATSQ